MSEWKAAEPCLASVSYDKVLWVDRSIWDGTHPDQPRHWEMRLAYRDWEEVSRPEQTPDILLIGRKHPPRATPGNPVRVRGGAKVGPLK